MQEGAEGQAEDRTQAAVVEQKSHPHAGNMLMKNNYLETIKIVSFMRAVRESLGIRKRNNEIST
jgi:hypothetical protein